ncbi:hypothetical protein EJ07DRAFT_121996 [Lizonia empirigonia]|nr:hypothetical protein EJ07DRAFT_121996 [Lizonia empirigonia]
MAKACVICGADEADGEQLLEAPCQSHWVCTHDVSSFFERAAENESLYPPKCCGQIFLLDQYEAYVSFEVQWAFQAKEQGEYSVLAKYRVYCASPTCSKFLNPSTHTKDPSNNITYAICQDETCGKLTCTSCRTLLDGVEGHTCEQNEDYKKFKQIATEKGFQECPSCASTVELAEACNHISCGCGTEFCYICGQQWRGIHGCPNYGPAIYDDEGYNQNGYHRDTGLNREGRTHRDSDGDSDDEDDEDNDGEEEEVGWPDPRWDTLQHVDEDQRAIIMTLSDEDRDMFLVNLQILLFEERGITFPGETNEDDDGDHEEIEEGDAAQNDDATGGDEPAVEDEETVVTGPGDNDDLEAADIVMAEATQATEENVEDGAVAGAGHSSEDTLRRALDLLRAVHPDDPIFNILRAALS